ncbi:hypothetical protein BELL_1267g00020 [Botrytis elliptica]|uniref:Stc1 domain-containing protein n=1 Tax=Botrytis elliptica TaxID=278938 RepID=A0A4Z1IQG4_9HELO|nr:hypothetical protein EAE99_005423 [Botrytis elliptica]TGO58947.1 hypothetical protein BELL_1267g00020 [Botrytis elliptica]
MSFRNNRYAPAAERAGVIPVGFKFKCRHCNIFKTKDCFSKKEISSYANQYAQNPGMKLDPIKSLLRCMGCKGGQASERQCEGPCSKWKSLDQFSKAQRSRGNGWCMECVQWKEGHHPEVNTTPAPGTELEQLDTTSDAPEPTTGSSYAASMASLSLGNTPNGSQLLRAAAGSQIENRSQSSMSNAYEGARTASSDVWSTRDSRRRAGPAIQYNAYDANGVRHSHEKAMTLTSRATSAVGASSATSVASGPALATRPVTQSPAATASRSSQVTAPRVVVNQSTGWAKPIGTRTAQPANPSALTAWAPESNEGYRRSAYDSSDDEM